MHKRAFLHLICFVTLAIISINKLKAQSNSSNYYTIANNFYNNKQFDSAIANLSIAIRLAPQEPINYETRGNAYFSKKAYALALPDYSKAINLNPRNSIFFSNRGSNYNCLNQSDSALQDFDRALQLKPNNVNAWHGHGVANSHKKIYADAIADFSKALLIDSSFFYSYNSRGLAYSFVGEYLLAVDDFKKAISLDIHKQRPYIVINIIDPLARLYRFSEAANYYKDFQTNYDKGFTDSPYWLFFKKYIEAVTQNLTQKDYRTAVINLKNAEDLYNIKNKAESNDEYGKHGYSSILFLKGYVLEQLNDIPGAEQAYEQTMLINPNQPDIISALKRLKQNKEILVQADDVPPTISILEPLANNRSISVEDDKVAGTKQHIRGQALDQSGIKSVMINNLPMKVAANGYFDTIVYLNPGINIFTIVATDKHANTVSQNIQIVTGSSKTNPASGTPVDNGALTTIPVYHAILIAESEYADKNIPSLQGPVSDMNKIYNLLVNNYAFTAQNTDTLVNATRTNILEAIIKKANALNDNESLFIFYAGHGQMITQPDNSEEGFLVPQDALKNMVSTYISSNDLLQSIKYSKAKHILFVADACFAGSLFRDIASEAPAPVALAYKDKSRKLLASGNRTAVPDKSEFIEYLRLALQENHAPYITAEQLIDSFKNQYTSTTHLTLQYYPIKDVDDLGGQFVFIRK